MATEAVYITGKLSWVRHITPNEWHKWTVTVHPTPESVEKIRELQGEGVKNVLSKDDDGWKVTFNRPVSREVKGKIIGLEPPMVVDKEGKLLHTALVGNGSDGVVKLDVYSHRVPGSDKKAKAARWVALRVDTLVPYEKDRDFDDTQKGMIKDLDKQPVQEF